tara:strand:- start:51862 stop:52032 length:171 start_codon:yes stop_codon:yes gene_type:complete
MNYSKVPIILEELLKNAGTPYFALLKKAEQIGLGLLIPRLGSDVQMRWVLDLLSSL